jgi:hypothetical protein
VADVRTVQLGQFTDDNAEKVAAALEQAGIVWWHKTSGPWTRVLSAGDWGTRIFVEEGRAEEAGRLAREVLDGPPAPGGREAPETG